MMPQPHQKLISRFFHRFTSPANERHVLNPWWWISQLKGARAHSDTLSPMCMHQPLTSAACSPGASNMQVPFHMCMGEKKKVIFKSSGTEVTTYRPTALLCSTWINRLLLLVLLKPEVAAGSAKPVVPINVGNTSTDMGISPSPSSPAQEGAKPFQQFLPSPEDVSQQHHPPTHPSSHRGQQSFHGTAQSASVAFVRHAYRINTSFLAY